MPIEKLDQVTIDRIAAGEVITHPVNAVKELMENSLDAKADSIEVSCLEGGLKQIKVKDNGSGINVHDLPLLCQRHSTSKLHTFDDLYRLTTFGFRGEALASISNVANITVYTKTDDSPCGFQATFKGGNMLNKPSLCASLKGTSILIQDLFQTTPIRLKGLKAAHEYKKIMDCIEKYAVHYFDTSFILKKNVIVFQVKKARNRIQRLKDVYHSQQEYQSINDKNHQFEFELTFSLEQGNDGATFILFVNGRLVENRNIKRKLYDVFLQCRHIKPSVVYLSLKIVDLSQIDVNIHPSKNEVALLNEYTYIQVICQSLTDELVVIPTQKKVKKNNGLPKMKTLDTYFSSSKKSNTNDNNEDTLSVVPQMKQNNNNNNNNKKKKKKDMTFIIHQLQQQVIEVKDKEATMLFTNQEYIGYIKDLLVLSMHNDTLYLFNLNMISEEFFYQTMLTQFGKCGHFKLEPPISIRACSELIGVSDLTASLFKHQTILQDYFHISLTENNSMESLPMLISNYIPTLDKIPIFLYRIVTVVDWFNDIQCIQDICREIALLYSCTNQQQYEQIKGLLYLMHVPRYIVQDDYLVEFDVPTISL